MINHDDEYDSYRPPWGAGHLRRAVVHWLMWWRWRARIECHGDRRCCQYVDEANCNNESAPRHIRHRDGAFVVVGGRRFGKTRAHLRRLEEARRHRRSGV